ncbi:MAG: chemotaxis protein CheW [Deltaproteobacteria bacterium]|nr:chemotaxis protein CheW [Deltaproteobacteria bacterium]MBK8235012.1 chemotaxis protein CheW [Deltaproteobacteria bacterium]MBK8716676.1 chemotaxis protein CheW [Deltaproteobacteria bacterium]MBP7285357.1 chemotaxis protein CheW [Nannocystaceae bacterium]
MPPTTRQLCTFSLGDLIFGVEVTHVQEVIRYQEMTSVPLAPRIIRGLINLRGQIVTAIDMRARLQLQPREGELPMNVVLRTADGVVSLLVDEIGDVVQTDESTFERVPETTDALLKELVSGVYKIEHRLLLLLDVDRVMTNSQLSAKGEAA